MKKARLGREGKRAAGAGISAGYEGIMRRRQAAREVHAAVRHQLEETRRWWAWGLKPEARVLWRGIWTRHVESQLKVRGTRLARSHGLRLPR